MISHRLDVEPDLFTEGTDRSTEVTVPELIHASHDRAARSAEIHGADATCTTCSAHGNANMGVDEPN